MAVRSAFLALAMCLSGCAAVRDTSVGAALSGLLSHGGQASPTAVHVPRAEIEKFGVAVMRVFLPGWGGDGFIVVRDDKGAVKAWAAGDGSLYTFRNGILIETRGLGADLMSSSAPSPGQILGGGSHGRSYFSFGEEDRMLRYDFSCRAQARGTVEITVQGKRHLTRHIVEECEGASGNIANEYWFEGQTIRKSREWGSPLLGYLEFERIVD
ncbi:YjbF family lipoprotein [Pseudogemmobacter sonorensis]|uniref:YjbF family lipoprotein n=1 Tax=Pseudogemmobacter sonorensis TaxID=2989681 RepID=UPI0036ACFB67